MWRRIRRSKPLVIGGLMVVLLVVSALAAPALATHDPTDQDIVRRLTAPGQGGHVLGTDEFGRDIWSRLVYGARISLWAGFLAVGIGAIVGLVLGLVGGYLGGWADMVVGRVFDVVMAFPTILLALAIVAALGPSLTNTIIAIGVTTVPRYGRVVRSAVLAIRSREFVEAAKAIGASDLHIMIRHVLTNVLSPLIVVSTVGVATAILTEATLSFLGLGVPPPTPSWGSIINGGKQYLELAPWISTFAGLTVMLAVLGFSLFGDGLRDVMDPRLKGRG